MSRRIPKGRGPVLIALILLALVAVGCNLSGQTPITNYKGNLTVWAAPGLANYVGGAGEPDAAWFQERAKAYEASHDGTKVELRVFASPQELEQAIQALSNGQPHPDLVFGRFLPGVAPRLAALEPLLGQDDLKDYLPGALDAFRYGGKLLGIPVLEEEQVLALNSKAFEGAGLSLPAAGHWTQDEFETSLKKLSGNGHYGLGFYALPGFHDWYPLAAGVFQPDGAVAAGAEAGLQRIARYRSEGLLYPDSAKVGAEKIWSAFAQNSPAIAVMPVGSWALPLLQKAPYNVKLSVAGFPGDITVGYTYGFSVFASQENAAREKAAVSLAQFMAAPDQQVRLARQTGLMPARKSAGNPFEGDAVMTAAYRLAANQRSLPAGPAWDQAEPTIARQLLYALLGSAEPKAVLAEIQKAVTPTSP